MAQFLGKSTVVRNTVWMLVGQGLRLVIQALYFTLIARSLGAGNYGAFVGVAALVGIVFPFSTLGSGALLVKNVARDKTLFARYWGGVLTTTGVAGSVLFVMVILLANLVLPAAIPRRLVCLVAGADLFGTSMITACGQAFQAFESLNWTATINVLMSACRLAGAVVLIAIDKHPSALQWGYLYFCSTTIAAIAAQLLVLVKLGGPDFSLRKSAAEMREGFYFSASLSAQTVYNDIDKTMLSRLSTLDATGIYGAAYRLIEVSFVPVSSVLNATWPTFFRTGSEGVSATLRYAKRLLVRVLAYSIPVSGILLLSAGVVPYILGPEYFRTVEALRWLALLPVLKSIHYFLADALTGAGFQGVRAGIQAGVAVFNFLINLWLIPAYSWRGAAWSSIASDALLVCGIGTAAFLLSRRPKPVLADAPANV
jgi:O-antigen/teichoic acid export membrane protein